MPFRGSYNITDPKVREVLKQLWDQIDLIQGVTGAAAWRGDVHAGDNKLTSLANGEADSDAVTVAQLRDATNLTRISSALSAGGSNPITTNITETTTITIGTHAERLATVPIEDSFFYETDRGALYADINGSWVLMVAMQNGSYAAKPGDLGLNDGGFIWYAQDRGVVLYWTGASWRWQLGTYTDTWANIPDPTLLSASTGIFFSASDRGYQLWRFSRVTTDWTYVGGGSPTRGTLASITGSLTTKDAGYLYYATDYDRVYRWTGTAYEDAPGQPARNAVSYFDQSTVPTGWAKCDGSAATISTATGGTAAITTPDLITLNRVIRAANTSGGSGGAATHTHDYSDVPAHSHNLLQTTAGGGGNNALDAGTIVTDSSASDPFSGIVTSTGTTPPCTTASASSFPPYLELVPMLRL